MTDERRRFYDEDQDIPKWLRWTFVAINRVGFPIVAFMIVCFYVGTSMKNMATAINKQSLALENLVITVNSNHEDSKQWRSQMRDDIRDLKMRIGK